MKGEGSIEGLIDGLEGEDSRRGRRVGLEEEKEEENAGLEEEEGERGGKNITRRRR